jgi:aspartate carbamoyltransferase catalytic subunit
MALSTKHLLGIKDLNTEDIQLILNTAGQFKEVLQRPVKKVPTLKTLILSIYFTKILQGLEYPLNWLKRDYLQM